MTTTKTSPLLQPHQTKSGSSGASEGINGKGEKEGLVRVLMVRRGKGEKQWG